MSREQIEEMAKNCHFYDDGVCHLCEELLVSCDRKCDLAILVENLYTAGYRKASKVADELINAALSKIQIMISAIKSQEESGNVTEFNGGAKTALEIVFKDLAELKKKYTGSGDTNDGT